MRSPTPAGRWIALAGALAFAQPAVGSPAEDAASEPTVVSSARVNGVELHYVDRGVGEPVVFIHGGLADYREWAPTAEALPPGFRTVTYSRRFSFPNANAPSAGDHAMLRDVGDAAGLIEALGLGPVHLVGASYGAFAALMVALHRPDLVLSVTAAEPPLLHWLPDIEHGQEAHDHFYGAVMHPSAEAFAHGDPERALTVALDYFVGPAGSAEIPAEVRAMLLANIEDWRAITTSPEALPRVTRDQLGAVAVPVLLISGGRTADVHRLVDPEVERAIPNAKRIVIAEGTHEVCSEQSAACAAAIVDFIGRPAL